MQNFVSSRKQQGMILKAFLGSGPDKNPYTKEAMAWKIFQLLPELIQNQKDEFLQVLRYLGDKTTGVDADRSFRLCRQIATLYDSYLTYRPEMIMDWQAGKHPDGQTDGRGVLWQSLRKAFGQEVTARAE